MILWDKPWAGPRHAAQQQHPALSLLGGVGSAPAPGNNSEPGPKAKAKAKAKANSDDKKGVKPNYNKKVGSKITQLSTKATEIRCLQTNVESSTTLCLSYVCKVCIGLKVALG